MIARATMENANLRTSAPLGARPDFHEWMGDVMAALESRRDEQPRPVARRSSSRLRRLASRFAK